jgi:hypothetical protein
MYVLSFTRMIGYRPEYRRRCIIERHPSKAEVTNLELAVAVGENVLGLEVPVEDMCGVDVLHAAEHLV